MMADIVAHDFAKVETKCNTLNADVFDYCRKTNGTPHDSLWESLSCETFCRKSSLKTM